MTDEYLDSGVAALRIAEAVIPPLSEKEQAFFIAGFIECTKQKNAIIAKMEEEKAVAVIAMRNALLEDNVDEAYFHLLKYADPELTKINHWLPYERLLQSKTK